MSIETARALHFLRFRVSAIALVFVVSGSGCGRDTASKRAAVVEELTSLMASVERNPADTVSLDKMIAMVNGDSSFARTKACVFLGDLGPLAAPAVPDLVRALNCGDGYVEREAARALGEIGPGAGAAVPALIAKLKNENDDSAWFAAESLGLIGQPALPAIPALEKASKSEVSNMKDYANAALNRLRASLPDAPPSPDVPSVRLNDSTMEKFSSVKYGAITSHASRVESHF